jgi:hypothetical protein
VADPPVEVLQGVERLVLIDAYRRVAALLRLGRDTACVECWACDLAESVLGVLARSQSRPLTAIEEALLVRELVQGGCRSSRSRDVAGTTSAGSIDDCNCLWDFLRRFSLR